MTVDALLFWASGCALLLLDLRQVFSADMWLISDSGASVPEGSALGSFPRVVVQVLEALLWTDQFSSLLSFSFKALNCCHWKACAAVR
jgi:hypothetical protein